MDKQKKELLKNALRLYQDYIVGKYLLTKEMKTAEGKNDEEKLLNARRTLSKKTYKISSDELPEYHLAKVLEEELCI